VRSEEGLVLLGDSCFKGCTALKKVPLPASVRRLENRGFEVSEGCTSLSKVGWLDDGPVEIGKGCFRRCALTPVVVPRGVRELGTGALRRVDPAALLLSVAWGGGPTSVGEGVFKDCKALSEVALPGSMTVGVLPGLQVRG
jgi:hypothetical protein